MPIEVASVDDIRATNARIDALEGRVENLEGIRWVPAESGSRDHIQRAIDLAVSKDANQVRIPEGVWAHEGTNELPDTIDLFGPNADLVKQGTGEGFEKPMIQVLGSGAVWRGDLILTGRGKPGALTDLVDIGLYCVGDVDVRIRGKYRGFGRTGIQFRGSETRFGAKRGNPRGVIWNFFPFHMGYLEGGRRRLGYGVEVVGDDKYDGLITPGDPGILTIEGFIAKDCRHTLAISNGGLARIRNGSIKDQPNFAHGIDMHGKVKSWPASGAYLEAMDVTIEGERYDVGVAVRGGKAVVRGITATGAQNGTVHLRNEGGAALPCNVWDVEPDRIKIEPGASNLGKLAFTECPYPHPARAA